MPDLEDRLRDLGGGLEWPTTPDVAPAVRARLGVARPPHRRARRPLLVLAAVLVTLAGGLAASPEARSTVLRLLRLRGATIERVDRVPTAPAPARSEPGAHLRVPAELGEAVTLAEARRRVPFPVLVPAALGPPDEVRVRDAVANRRAVSLLYAPRRGLPATRVGAIGLLLTQFRGAVAIEFVGKLAGPGTRVERLTVEGRPAVWLEGEPHFVFHRDPEGDIVEETLRVAGNTLLWERDGLLLRLEARVDRAEAVRIARSLGP